MDDRLNLVTGCFGFSGSYVLRELLRSGQRVVGTDLPSALKNDDLRRTLRAVGLELDHPDLELVSADLLDPSSLGPLFERPVTHVFHTASLYDYSAPLERLRRINVEGGRNLLEAALGRRLARFLHWSTCGVFGKPYTAADGPRVNVPFSERSPSPRNTPDDAAEPPGTCCVAVPVSAAVAGIVATVENPMRKSAAFRHWQVEQPDTRAFGEYIWSGNVLKSHGRPVLALANREER